MKTLYLLLAGLGLVLVTVPSVKADGCRRVVTIDHGGHTGHVVHKGFDYRHNSFYGHHDVVLKPYAIPVAIIPSTFYQVAPELALARIQKEIADEAAEKAARRVLEGMIRSQAQAQPPAPPGSAPAATSPDPEPTLTATASVQKIADNKCLKCHGKGDKLDLTDVAKLDEKVRSRLVLRVMTDDKKKAMPKDGPPLSGEELNAFHAFALEASLK